MTDKLRLGPLPRTESVRLTVSLSAAVKIDLDRYAEIFSATHGEQVDIATLIPHMLAAFMDRDRAFRRVRQALAGPKQGFDASASTAARSTTSDTAGDTSPSG